jgi:hypothetical protein
MNNALLGFLNEIKVNEVAAPVGRLTTKKETNPASNFMGIRVWKDGSIFPSRTLVDTYNLEYPKATVTIIDVHNEDGSLKKDAEGKQVVKRTVSFPEGSTANGLDIFALADWTQVDETVRANKLILVGITSKSMPKVEVFSNVKYNDDGTPQNSVMDQGATTYGRETLLPLVKSVYGMEPGENGYIDLEINPSFNLKSKVANGVFLIPKTIVRGEKKGHADYLRRENIDVLPMTPVVPVQSTIDQTSTAIAEMPQDIAESVSSVPA